MERLPLRSLKSNVNVIINASTDALHMLHYKELGNRSIEGK